MKKKQQFSVRFGNRLRLMGCLIVILAFGIADFVHADAGCCLASASAQGIRAKTSAVNKTLGSASIGCNGGNKTNTLGTVSIPDLLDAVAIQTSATGTTTQTSSSARVDNVNVFAGSNVVRATQISSNAQASCNGNPTASSNIQNLTINGQPVNVTGEINQEISISGGKIILNAQSVTGSGCVKKINVTAMRILVFGVADISISTSHAGVACVIFSCN
jgi:hypothetical protein